MLPLTHYCERTDLSLSFLRLHSGKGPCLPLTSPFAPFLLLLHQQNENHISQTAAIPHTIYHQRGKTAQGKVMAKYKAHKAQQKNLELLMSLRDTVQQSASLSDSSENYK